MESRFEIMKTVFDSVDVATAKRIAGYASENMNTVYRKEITDSVWGRGHTWGKAHLLIFRVWPLRAGYTTACADWEKPFVMTFQPREAYQWVKRLPEDFDPQTSPVCEKCLSVATGEQ